MTVLQDLELLLAASPGLIAVRLAVGRWPFQPVVQPSQPDPEMLRLAAWSDELEPPVCAARGSCEP